MNEDKKIFSLVYIFDSNEQILLGLKKRGLGEGLWNGFGGKLMKNEIIEHCAIREVHEECGLIVELEDLIKVAEIRFRFFNSNKIFEQHVFQTYKFSGEVLNSEEMQPKWFHKCSLPPYHQMWLDQEFWHHLMFKNYKFKGDFLLDGFKQVLRYEIELLDDF